MDDKQIIIDGVDVSECNFTLERDGKIKCECTHATGFGVICDCENWKTCDYKNYKRKEQECERLKEQFKLAEPLYQSCNIKDKKIKKYEQTLTEIKEMLKEICMEECSFDWNKTSKKHCGDCDCRYGQILQKINEVE